MTIPTTIATSKEEDASLAQLHAEDAEEPVTVALSGPSPAEGLRRKLILLFGPAPGEDSSFFFGFPADLLDCPVISPTKPAELTNLPQETWTELYNEMKHTDWRDMAFEFLMAITIMVALFALLVLTFLAVLPKWIIIVAVVGLLLCCCGAYIREDPKTRKLQRQLESDFGSRFAAAGYHLSLEKACEDRWILQIQPIMLGSSLFVEATSLTG